MIAMKDAALAALRWGWEKLVAFAKAALAKLTVVFNTVYDPPPKTIRFWFWSFTAIAVTCWLTFAFVNSWFYKPTVEFFATLGDDGDVFLHEPEPLPSVPIPAVTVPSVEVVCQDMSDTPQCEPVLPPKAENGGNVEVTDIPQPVVKPVSKVTDKTLTMNTRKKSLRKVGKHQPYVTYWGF